MNRQLPAIRDDGPSWPAPGRAAGHRVGYVATIVLLMLAVGHGTAGCAVARVSGPSESQAAALMAPAPLTAETRIIHYPDGHAVVTRDAHGTDITVQRIPGDFEDHGFRPRPYDFGDPDVETRFRWQPRHENHQPSPSLRDEYRQRMLERLDSHP